MRSRRRVVTAELVPYAQAPWAPVVVGAKWAYRITTVTGNTLVAASVRSRTDVEAEIRRLTQQLEGGIPHTSFRHVAEVECARTMAERVADA